LARQKKHNLEKLMNITNQQQNESAVPARQDQQPIQYVSPLADVESTKEG